MYIHLLRCLLLAVLFFYTTPIFAQSNPTVRLPLCLEFPDSKSKVPCTGVVPVDPLTGNPQSWSSAMGGSSAGTVGGPAPNTAQIVAGKDIDGRVKTLSVDTAGVLNVNCTGCTGGGSGTPVEQTNRRAFWSETTDELDANQSFTGMSHDNGGSISGAPSRWNSFSCFGTSDQEGMVYLQASNDNNNWFTVQNKTMSGALPNVYLSQPMFTKYWRCRVVNGATRQGNFLLNSGFGM